MKNKEHYTKDYYIGLIIAELFLSRYMPCLEVDGFNHRVKDLSSEDYEKYLILDENSPKDFKAFNLFRKELENKYLPKEIEAYFPELPDEINSIELKKGIGDELWNSDISYYSATNINTENIYRGLKVTFNLND